MVPVDSDRVSRAPPYSGVYRQILWFRLSGYHALWLNFPVVFNYQMTFLLTRQSVTCLINPTTPLIQRLQAITYQRFRLFQFRSPLLSESFVYFLFVLLLRCFSSQAFLHLSYLFTQGFWSFIFKGFPHSDSRGSRLFSSSPRLFAALHVLRRLSMPRHPPLALCSFTYLVFVLFKLYCLVSLMITYILSILITVFIKIFDNAYNLMQFSMYYSMYSLHWK